MDAIRGLELQGEGMHFVTAGRKGKVFFVPPEQRQEFLVELKNLEEFRLRCIHCGADHGAAFVP